MALIRRGPASGLRSHHPQAAGDPERLAGHVRGVVGGEEGDRGRDLLGLPSRRSWVLRIVSMIFSPISPNSSAPISSGVSIGPGAIAFAVIPKRAPSRRSPS